MEVDKNQFLGFLLGSFTVFLFWIIFDLITKQTIDHIFVLIYWDVMLAFEIGVILFSNKIINSINKKEI